MYYTFLRNPMQTHRDADTCRANLFLVGSVMAIDTFSVLDLPPELIVHLLKNYTYERLNDLLTTCKTINKLIEENRNSLASKDIYHIDLERRRVRAWRDFSWCDRIPFRSFEYISKFFCNVNVKVLTVNKLDEEICEFLIEKANKKMLRFEQLRLFHSFSVSHSSIQRLLKAGRCTGINFEAVESNMKPSDLSLEGYQSMDAMCFEMDDSIDGPFFESVLEVSKATKFIFHACDKIPQAFVRSLFQKWLNGSRKIDSVRITTNQNFSFDEIIEDLKIQKVDNSTWKMKNAVGDNATITMRRNNFHFFVAFEVNEHRVEDILYNIPFIE